MKATILIILQLCTGYLLLAQQIIRITPDNVRRQVQLAHDDLNYEEIMRVEVKNVSERQLRLRWDKRGALPYSWESIVCDPEASYPTNITSNYDPMQGVTAPLELAPGATCELFIRILPYNTTGHADLTLVFRDVDQPERQLGRAEFTIDITDSEDTANIQASGSRIKIYPNPVHDRFFVTGAPELSRIDIYNTLGRRLRTIYDPLPGDSFRAGDLPQGVYLVSLVDKQGKVVKTLRLLRREFRP